MKTFPIDAENNVSVFGTAAAHHSWLWRLADAVVFPLDSKEGK